MGFHFLIFPKTKPLTIWLFRKLFHKLIRNFYGNVEVSDFSLYLLSANKIQNIWMINLHHRHIRAVPALLFNNYKRVIVDAQKFYRTGRHTIGPFCWHARVTQMRKIKTQTRTSLLK